MAVCEQIVSCDNLISTEEVFLKTLLKTSDDCPAVLVTPFADPVECFAATCDNPYSTERIIKEVGILAASGSIAVAIVADDLEERITCDDMPALETLLSEAFTQSTDCKTLRVRTTTSDSNCTNQVCGPGESLQSIIAKTFMKSEESGCTVILVTEKEATDRYPDCSINEPVETTVRKLLVPSTEFAGHYAWVVNGSAVSADVCYVFEFDTVTPDDQIWAFNYNNGTQDLSGLTIDLSAGQTETQIADAIKNAFNTVPITYDDVTVSRNDIGGGLFRYTITIKNPNFTIDIIDVSGSGTASSTTDCT